MCGEVAVQCVHSMAQGARYKGWKKNTQAQEEGQGTAGRPAGCRVAWVVGGGRQKVVVAWWCVWESCVYRSRQEARVCVQNEGRKAQGRSRGKGREVG